jgi:hypothetical protein
MSDKELNVTPGEWTYEASSDGYSMDCVYGPSGKIAIIIGDSAESEANAHLMAASKELYEALQRMVKLFAYCDCHHADCTECEKFEFADAALAKARGEDGDV